MDKFFKSLQENAKRYPSSLAFIGSNVVLNYRGLEQSINNIATKALSLDIKPGSSVCVRCQNPNVQLLTNLGLMRAGMKVAIATKPEIFAEHDFTFDVFITDGAAAKGWEYKANKGIRLTADWSQPHQFSKRKIADHPYSLIFASSGSTGRGKLLEASRKNVEYRIGLKEKEPYFQADTRFLSLAQPNSMTTFADMLITLMNGGQVIRLGLMPPEQSLDAITVYQPTYVSAAPYSLVGMLDSLTSSRRRFRKVEYLRVAGAYCAPDVRKKAKDLFADNVITSYGATETGRIAFGEYDEIAGVEGAVGRVIPGFEIEALDDDGNALPVGTDGELRMKPPAGSALTYITAEGPKDPLKDGWFYPGDIGHVTEDNVLVISGRKSNVINFGGNKLDPERIEAAIRLMDGVDDVAVAAQPGANGFDVIHCLVEGAGRLTAADMNAFLVSSGQSFQVESVHKVNAIPRTDTNKISRPGVLEAVQGKLKNV